MWDGAADREGEVGMRLDMKIGERSVFMGEWVECAENEHVGRLRCRECTFEEMPQMCWALSCRPGQRTQRYYRLWTPKRRRRKQIK